MNRAFKILIFALVFPPIFALSIDKGVSTPSIEVLETDGGIVVIKDGKRTKLIAPESFHKSGRFVLRLDDSQSKNEVKTPPIEAKVRARESMYRANRAFFKGDIDRAWVLVKEAEELDPHFFRIKSMKGSLLYKVGAKDLAVVLWEESLAMEPNQPDIEEALNQTKKILSKKASKKGGS